MQTTPTILEILTGERDQRLFAGLVAALVVLVHFWLIAYLNQSANVDKKAAPVKVMEVALVRQEKPKEEIVKPVPQKPAPSKPAPPPKKAPPPKPLSKKPETKPPVKKKEAVLPKAGDIAVPKTEIKTPVKPEPYIPPKLVNPFQNTPLTSVKSQAAPVKKPAAAKPGGNGDNPKGGSSGVVPLVTVKPVYPARAMSRRIEGWVKIEFTVTASGSVANPVVAGASPAGMFEDAALDAIRKWKFKQKIVNGSPVAQRAVQKLSFKLMR